MADPVRIAFIGTRGFLGLPDRVRTMFTLLGREVAERHGVVVTGAAVGADQTAAETALAAGGLVHLVLPWASYEERWIRRIQSQFPRRVTVEVYDVARHPAWTDSVRTYHPAFHALSRGAIALHARNYGIVAGAAAVVAAAHDARGGGGTGQGIRMARGLGIPVFDLWAPTDPEPALLALLG